LHWHHLSTEAITASEAYDMANLSKTTRDHDEIRKWAEARGAKPAHVKSTESNEDIGILRLDFPGFSGEGSLEEITWDQFFEKFDERNLALIYQEETAGGEKSNFNKIVSAETADAAETKSRRGGARARGGAAKKAAKKATAGRTSGIAKKAAAKAPAKKTATKKAAAKKASPPAKKSASKKSASSRGATKKTAVRASGGGVRSKTATKKVSAKKTSARSTPAKRGSSGRASGKKVAAKKTGRSRR
jgi:hypothetical protein